MASLLTGLLLLASAGLFLAMPGRRQPLSLIGWILLAAGAGVLITLIGRLVDDEVPVGAFTGCALVGLFAAVRVITHSKPVYSALYFVLLVIAIAGMLLLMNAEFLTAALIIVYAGAILVTYVFVIMLAQRARPAPYDTKSRDPFLSALLALMLLGILAGQFQLFDLDFTPLPDQTPNDASVVGGVVNVGTPLLTQYVVGIQLAGLLLLVAMVGAIAIARRTPEPDPEGGPD
jgi:NADH-quinone oxidoreductase subunit J